MKRNNMTKFDKAVSAAFTGHRFYNFSQQEVIRERLTKAIPFRGQADRFKPGDRMVYDGLMASAGEVIILSEYYYTRCFLDRDEFMVENASLLIAFYDGREKGGTYYTFKKANSLGIPVVNIY